MSQGVLSPQRVMPQEEMDELEEAEQHLSTVFSPFPPLNHQEALKKNQAALGIQVQPIWTERNLPGDSNAAG